MLYGVVVAEIVFVVDLDAADMFQFAVVLVVVVFLTLGPRLLHVLFLLSLLSLTV